MKTLSLKRFAVIAAFGLAPFGLAAAPAAACAGCGCAAGSNKDKVASEAAGTDYVGNKKDKESKAATGDIVETAASAGTFNTLLAAATAAGLVETLQSEGPLTLFAPTDKAFAALPEGTVESLLLPENKDQLVSILTYHVVAGKVEAKDALAAGEAATVQGGTLTFTVEDHGDHKHAFVNGIEIVKTDIQATNGVIHVVGGVILPPAE